MSRRRRLAWEIRPTRPAPDRLIVIRSTAAPESWLLGTETDLVTASQDDNSKQPCRRSHHALLRLHHEFNSLHRSRGVLVDQGQVTRRQAGEFPPPSCVRNFHSQNTVGKTQRPSPIGNRTATRHRPGQQRALACRRAMKSFGDDGFQAGGSTVQDTTPDSRTRSERRSER